MGLGVFVSFFPWVFFGSVVFNVILNICGLGRRRDNIRVLRHMASL